MKKLIESIKPLIQEELVRANEKFPQFHSSHEGYAVIKEEVEEAQSELNSVLSELWNLWSEIKDKESIKENLVEDAEELIKHANNLIAESIQVAAMGKKFLDMLEREATK